MTRDLPARRDAAREFFIHNQGRIIFGTDQVSGDDRGFAIVHIAVSGFSRTSSQCPALAGPRATKREIDQLASCIVATRASGTRLGNDSQTSASPP